MTTCTREMGIRIALGAQPHQVTAMILKEGAVLAAVGTALRLLAAFWLTRLITQPAF